MYVTADHLPICEDCTLALAGHSEHELGRPYPPDTLKYLPGPHVVFSTDEDGCEYRDDADTCEGCGITTYTMWHYAAILSTTPSEEN